MAKPKEIENGHTDSKRSNKSYQRAYKEITASKEKAQRYLKDSGIDDYVKRTLRTLSKIDSNGKQR